MNKLHIILITLFLLLPSALALGEYYAPGTQTYNLEGLWSTNIQEGTEGITANQALVTFNGSWTSPLVGDLDNDGLNEIVVIDGSNVELYQNKTLEGLAGQPAEDPVQHAILFDIDGDDTLEVLTVGGDKYSIFDYNGTALTLTNNYTILNSTGADSYQYMIGCGTTERCIIVNARTKGGVPSTESIYAMRANSSGVYNSTTLKTSQNNGDYTLPKIRAVSYENMDGSGNQFVFSSYDGGFLDVCYWYVSMTDNSVTEDFQKCISASQIFGDTGRDDFTSPLVGEFSPTDSGREVVMAYQADSAQEFEMILYASNGVEIDDYPDLTFTQGTIISNPVRANVFDGTSGNRDFCVLGYWTQNDELKLLCGSAVADEDEAEFDYDGTAYDLSETDFYPINLLHAVQIDDSLQNGIDTHEFLTPYGIFSIDFGVLDDTLEAEGLITDFQNGIAIPTDAEQTGYFDILYRTESALIYFDDGFTNTQTSIRSSSLTPTPLCTGRVYTLTITVQDIDGDTSTCWVEIEDEGAVSLQNLTNKTGTSTIAFYYTPTTTSGLEFGTIYCTDSISPAPDTAVFSREISNNTAICNDPSVDPEEINYEADDEEQNQQEVEEAIDDVLDDANLNYPGAKLIIGLIIAALCGLWAWNKTKDRALTALAFVVGMIIAIAFSFIEMWVLVTLVIIAAAYTVYKLGKGGGGNGP